MFSKGKSYLATDVDNKVDFKARYSLMRVSGQKAFFKVVPICKAAKSTIILADLVETDRYTTLAKYHGITINSNLEAVI